MPKKILIIVSTLALLLAGGFFAVQVFTTQQAQKAAEQYAASSDKIADDFLRDLIAQNSDDAYTNLYSPTLQKGYDKSYWAKTFFPPFKDYKGQPTKHLKEPVHAASNNVPNAYDPRFNQEPTRYEYDFKLQNLSYRVTFVIYKTNGQWKLNELSGAYLP